MHILFFNPQGNFDRADSDRTEHPDFGGQWVYVKEIAMAMVAAGHKVDIVTRRIIDPEWPEFSASIDYYDDHAPDLRIVRIPCATARRRSSSVVAQPTISRRISGVILSSS